MQYVIEARLENGEPELSVIDRLSGHVKLRWRLERIHEMFDSGEIKREEFLQPEKYGMQLLLKNLFLIACAQNLEACETRAMSRKDDWQFNLSVGPHK